MCSRVGQGGPGAVLGQCLAPQGAPAATAWLWARVWVIWTHHNSSRLLFRREKGNWGNLLLRNNGEDKCTVTAGFLLHFFSMRQNLNEFSSSLHATKIHSTYLPFPSRFSPTTVSTRHKNLPSPVHHFQMPKRLFLCINAWNLG